MRTDPQTLAMAQDVFEDLLDTPPTEREAALEERCSGNPQVMTLVNELLVIHDEGMGRFLERPLGLPQTLGAYEVKGLLGRGGMGAVYEARDTRLQRDVALKTLTIDSPAHQELFERLESEARTLARLNHPHIATIHALEEHGGVRFFVMEKVDGEDLGTRLRRTPLSVEETLQVGRQITSALEAAHAANIVHRDLKPSNILISQAGAVKIVDFGIARTTEDPTHLDQPGSGTPGYMSPEQVGGHETGPATDLWALGCLLYECLTGVTAFDKTTRTSPRPGEADPTLPDLEDLPEDTPILVRKLIEVCLSLDPQARTTDAAAARTLFESECDRRRFARISTQRAGPSANEAAATFRNTLPFSITSFIGRHVERGEIGELIEHAGCISIVGPGGCGKTRLAIEVARERCSSYPGGVWFVELADADATSSLEPVIAQALEVPDSAQHSLVEALREQWSGAPALLLLDNCDRRLQECAAFAEQLLRVCPNTRLLVTSRERLRWPGERVYELSPMPVDQREAVQETEAGAYTGVGDAVDLFLDRAEAATGSKVPERDWPVARSVCQRLEGVPLAIELAAAGLRLMTLTELDARLAAGTQVLAARLRGSDPRHATLRAAIDWTVEELTPNVRRFFRRLAIFEGGFSLPAIEAVLAADDLPGWSLFESLEELVEKSLITRDLRAGATTSRFRLLHVIREHAHGLLREAGEETRLRSSHHAYFLGVAKAGAEALLGGQGQIPAIDQLEEEMDNFRAALRYDIDRARHAEDPSQHLQLSQALGNFWTTCGHWREGIQINQRLLETVATSPLSVSTAALHNATGVLLQQLGQFKEGASHFERALEINEHMEDTEGIATSLGNLGIHAFHVGDTEACRSHLEASARHWESIGRDREVAKTRQNLGVLAYTRGNYPQAQIDLNAALHHYRATEDRKFIGRALLNLGNVHYLLGDFDEAGACQSEACQLAREVGDKVAEFSSLNGLGLVAQAHGDFDRAAQCYEEGVTVSREHGDRLSVARGLHNLGTVASERGDFSAARQLLGESLDIRISIGDRDGIAESELSLGVAQIEDDPNSTASQQSAAKRILDSLTIYHEMGQQLGTIRCLEQLSRLTQVFDQTRRQTILDAADVLRRSIGAPRQPKEALRLPQDLISGPAPDATDTTGATGPSGDHIDPLGVVRSLLGPPSGS